MAERLGIVAYTNVAPLHWQLEPWQGCEFVYGVPTELNAMLLAGEIDLTLMSSVEFLRHRHRLKALPDFSISSLGAVRSVLLFHWQPWQALDHTRIALTSHSATSVALLKLLLAHDGIQAHYETVTPDLDAMLQDYDAALLIGDAALREYHYKRTLAGRRPFITDLGMQWYRQTSLPFTFAVWATRADTPPSSTMLRNLRHAREHGIGNLAAICQHEASKLGIPQSLMQRYLHNFRYYLAEPDKDALLRFGSRVVPDFSEDSLQFWDM